MAKNKNVRNRRKKSRKNSGLRWHKRGIVLTTLVIVLLGGMVTAGSVSLWSRNNAYKAQEAELQAQIEAEETRSEEIKEYEAYVQTDEYIRETAEDKLHLADPNEIIFRPIK